MNYLRSTLAAGFALFTASLASAETFEGQIDMKMSEGRQQVTVSYQTKPGHMRIAMPVEGAGEAATIVDFEESKILTLIPQMQAYMEIPFGQTMETAQRQGGQGGELRKTDETAEILGYPTTKYVYEDREGTVEIWATDQLGQFMSMPKGNPMQGGRGAAPSGWEAAMQGDFFPMRVVGLNPRGRERMRWEVTAVKPMSLPDSLFEAPEGYKPFNMGNLMQGLGGLRGN